MHSLQDRSYRGWAWLTLGIALTGTHFAGSARAATILYDNGAIVGTQGDGAPTITGSAVIDSFQILSPSTITGTANVGLWVAHGDVPSMVGWSISSSPFSNVILSGTASWNASFLFTNPFNFDIYSASFSIPNLPVGAGTYYLALSNAVTVLTGQTYWDRSGGPSQVFNGGNNSSNSFQIIGSVGGPVSTPEPGTIGLFAVSLVALRSVRRYL